MAMAFAPVAMQKEITLLDPSVVNKSYPSFWKHVSILLSATL
jgi:3-phosphoshikimate 1-carboxyvinyltransferase